MTGLTATILSVAIAAVLVTRGLQTHQAAQPKSVAAQGLVATVERGSVRESVEGAARVTAGRAVAVSAPTVEGRIPIITRRPVHAGDPVHAGQVLVEVADRPVFALPGRLSAFREMRYGQSGSDITQLKNALRRLGYGLTATGDFDLATAAAVRALYAGAGAVPWSPAGEFTARTKLTQLVIPLGEVVFLPRLPARVVKTTGTLGRPAGSEVLQVTAAAPRLVGTVPTTTAARLRDGLHVELRVPGRTAPLRARVQHLHPGAADTAITSLTLTLPRPVDLRLLGRAFRMEIVLREATGSLIVPTSAIRTDASGRTWVTVAGAHPHTEDVTVVAVSAGRAAITPERDEGLTVGDRVRMKLARE